MRLRLYMRRWWRKSPIGWRLGSRPIALASSLTLHALVVAMAFVLPPTEASRGPQSLYRSVVLPLEREHKIIWYRFRDQLPEVSPASPSPGNALPPPAQRRAKQPIVAAPRQPPANQFVWVPQPKLKLQADLTAPNLINLQAPKVVPPPPRPAPKAFRAPEVRKKAAVEAPPVPVPPGIEASSTNKTDFPMRILAGMAPSRPAKEFVPPMRHESRTSVGSESIPAPPSLAPGAGMGSANVAIVGLHPADVAQIPMPEGDRQARVLAGPEARGSGNAGLGGGNTSIVVPDLAIRGGGSTPAATRIPQTGLGTAAAPTVVVPAMPAPRLPSQATPSVSVAHWPNARTLPQIIERYFQGRVVYTTVIPTEQSSGDWVVWFAEQEPTPPGARLLMRPPGLLRTVPLPSIAMRGEPGNGRVRICGTIHQDGHLGSISEFGAAGPSQQFLQALQEWQFNPAMRNGTAIDINVIIEIPLIVAKD